MSACTAIPRAQSVRQSKSSEARFAAQVPW
jgi:hypothetical protein